MPHLHHRRLLDTPLVTITDVACDSPRCGPGAEEDGGVAVTLVVPRRGVFCVHRGSQEVAVDPNSVLLIGGGVDYRFSHPAAGGDDCTALVFAPELVEEALGSAPASQGLASPRAQLGVATLTAALRRARPRLAAEEAAVALLAELAPSLNPAARPVRLAPAGLRRAQRVRALLAASPGTPWRLDSIARAVSCSPFHLARQFRAATGETIARYLLRLRLAAAAQRVADGEDGLARLAVELGFSHHSHLTARFHAAFGVTPSEARKIVTVEAPITA